MMDIDDLDQKELNGISDEVSDSQECTSSQGSISDELFARPDWECCPDSSLDVGCDYVYSIGTDFLDTVSVRGRVLFNDGVTAILRVTNCYEELRDMLLYYNEVKRFFPEFNDPDAQRFTEYLCLDVETESILFDKDPDTGIIGEHRYTDT